MCCQEKNQESQCCLAAHKEKLIPCVVAVVSLLVVSAGLLSVFHCHKEDCCKKAE